MFEVGDTVYSQAFGEGVVTEIHKDASYPVKVCFSNSTKQGFTSQGSYYQTEVDPMYDISFISRPETTDTDPSDLPIDSFGIMDRSIVRIIRSISSKYEIGDLFSGEYMIVSKSSVKPLPDNITITNPSFEYILNEHKTRILATIVKTPTIDLIGINDQYQILDKSPTI